MVESRGSIWSTVGSLPIPMARLPQPDLLPTVVSPSLCRSIARSSARTRSGPAVSTSTGTFRITRCCISRLPPAIGQVATASSTSVDHQRMNLKNCWPTNSGTSRSGWIMRCSSMVPCTSTTTKPFTLSQRKYRTSVARPPPYCQRQVPRYSESKQKPSGWLPRISVLAATSALPRASTRSHC